MQKFVFEKGDSTKVLLNGKPLGGVKSFESETKKELYEIKEYLNAAAVKSTESRYYVLRLRINGDQGLLFSSDSQIESIELAGEKTGFIYSECCVCGFEALVQTGKPTEYKITVIAQKGEEK